MATLVALREQFVRQNGRHDLVTDFAGAVYTNAGADVYLNRGQRFLDLRMPHSKIDERFLKKLSVSDYFFEIQYLRNIKEVFLVDPEEPMSKIFLKEITLKEVLNAINNDMEDGVPAGYAMNVIGLSTEQEDLSSLSAFDGVDDMVLSHYDKEGIIFTPPADKVYTLHVIAAFYNSPLSGETDTSFWTVYLDGDLLLIAAQYELSLDNRNDTESTSWLKTLNRMLVEVDKDQVERTVSGPTRFMKG